MNYHLYAALQAAAGTSSLAQRAGQGAVIGAITAALLWLFVQWVRARSLGTRSVLYGAHCFFLHPFFVAAAWYQLYGFRKVHDRYVGAISLWNPRLWLVFFLHDLGYIGKANMDDDEGETHPLWGARAIGLTSNGVGGGWYYFSLLHSRYYAKTLGMQPSRLCIADKLSLALIPAWLYLPMVRATGEIEEYMRLDIARRAAGEDRRATSFAEEKRLRVREEKWFSDCQRYMRDWVAEHKDGAEDTWTKKLFKDGVYGDRGDYVVGDNLDDLTRECRTSITDSGVTA